MRDAGNRHYLTKSLTPVGNRIGWMGEGKVFWSRMMANRIGNADRDGSLER